MKQLALEVGLRSEPTFANYHAGPNEAAARHLQLWADSATRSPVPTYLWGDSGSGKTHLLHSARQALRQAGSACGWLTSALHEPPPFDPTWAAVLMDDVHLYTAVQQQAAFAWFVEAMNPPDGRPRGVLAAGALPPTDLALRDDLRSRLGWGHVFELHPLSEAQRREVLRQLARARGLVLSNEVTRFMLTRFARDLVSLTLLLDELDAYALARHRAITVPLIRAMLEDA